VSVVEPVCDIVSQRLHTFDTTRAPKSACPGVGSVVIPLHRFAGAGIACLFAMSPLGAQNAPDGARRIVGDAIAALGGLERLQSLRTIRIHGTGTEFRSAQVQGPSPERETPTRHEEWLTVDVANERAALEYHTARHDGSDRWRRFAYEGDRRTVVDFLGRFASRVRFPAAPGIRRDLARRVPHFLLLEAWQLGDSLQPAGDTTLGGARHAGVRYTPPGHRVPVTLWIDAATHTLSRVSYTMDFAGIGDAELTLDFVEWREDARLGRFPTGHSLFVRGRRGEVVRYAAVAVNDTSALGAFVVPDDLEAQVVEPGTVQQPAPGVFVVHALAGFTTMFVEFREFVLAIEAPTQSFVELDQIPSDAAPPTDAVTEQMIAKIKATIPAKPIRFVAVTHFHNDHGGGVRPFWAEGATLLTTPGTRSYFEGLARDGGSRIRPDRMSRDGAKASPLIEVVDGRRVVTDGERRVEIINTGRTRHTDEALVVYFPRERMIYQGDQFYFSDEGSFPPRDRVGVMREFARWIERERLDVERVYGTHMSGFAARRHLEAVARMR
jgi:glyoxylase-like metal-dependent hydrolase (beta-lactamase superfamily II)